MLITDPVEGFKSDFTNCLLDHCRRHYSGLKAYADKSQVNIDKYILDTW